MAVMTVVKLKLTVQRQIVIRLCSYVSEIKLTKQLPSRCHLGRGGDMIICILLLLLAFVVVNSHHAAADNSLF